jgi:hypothetical protein
LDLAVTEKDICNNRKYSNQRKTEEVVEPLTNYNVLVLDQRFRQNSSVSFINTQPEMGALETLTSFII